MGNIVVSLPISAVSMASYSAVWCPLPPAVLKSAVVLPKFKVGWTATPFPGQHFTDRRPGGDFGSEMKKHRRRERLVRKKEEKE